VRFTRASRRTAAAIGVAALLAVGCGRAGGGTQAGTAPASSPASAAATSPAAAGGGDFGTLTDVCHGGSASGSTDQGVTSTSIRVGVLSDYGFTKDPQLVNAAQVFTSWCDAQGGIDGRKLDADIHDTELMNVVSAMTSACGSDFVLAGDSAALDGVATDTRLKCLLPDFNAQPIMPQNQGSALELTPYISNFSYAPYAGYYKWLFQRYPASAGSVGTLYGQAAVTQYDSQVVAQTVTADGGTLTYSQGFPPAGVPNWAPYAEAIKAKGVKGLVFDDTVQALAALEQALDVVGYHLDWIDANADAYGSGFIQLAGQAVTEQVNYASLPGVYPLEKAAGDPAEEQLTQLFRQYAPGQPVTLQVALAFSSWLEFAEAAESCGSDLTRSCVYQAAIRQTAWTGGGLTAPVNEAQPLGPPGCFDIEQATSAGWHPATGFTPNTDGVYSCGGPVIRLTGFPPPAQLSDVGETLSDLR
jgi:hypothetical protein